MMVADGELYPFVDPALARRLERTEARSCAEFVEARAGVSPEGGAEWIEVAGAYAMFDTTTSPITQTFGLGMFGTITRVELEEIEDFFQKRGAPVFHEVSPLADPSLWPLLNERGYQPVEFTSVMFRPVRRQTRYTELRDDRIRTRIVGESDHELWAQTSARGWSEFTEYADLILDLARVGAKRPGGLSFLAELDGQAIATGSMTICDGVALMAGASTIPAGRRRGAQLALLDARLRYAAEHDCDLAMMCASPGSASQRNAERQGFRIAYTRVKWRLAQPTA